MAANDAQQIQGGNFQIFEGMVAKSGAEVRLETKIARVRKLEPQFEGEEPQFEVTTTGGQKQIFDYIIIAAPIVSHMYSLFCMFECRTHRVFFVLF